MVFTHNIIKISNTIVNYNNTYYSMILGSKFNIYKFNKNNKI